MIYSQIILRTMLYTRLACIPTGDPNRNPDPNDVRTVVFFPHLLCPHWLPVPCT